MRKKDAKQIDALGRYLKGWRPLWEEVRGRWRLVFLSPQLLATYKAAQEPFYSHGLWCPEPEYKFHL